MVRVSSAAIRSTSRRMRIARRVMSSRVADGRGDHVEGGHGASLGFGRLRFILHDAAKPTRSAMRMVYWARRIEWEPIEHERRCLSN